MTNSPRTDSRLELKRPGILAGVSGLFIFAVLSASFWPVTTTQAAFNGQQCRLPDSGFGLQWQHSVERENWREDYLRQGNRLLLVRSRFKTYGAGTPNDGILHENSDGLVDYRLKRPLKELSWVVSDNVQSTLWIQGHAWPVHAWLDDYTTLDFHVRRLPLWQFLMMDSCDEHFRQLHSLRQ